MILKVSLLVEAKNEHVGCCQVQGVIESITVYISISWFGYSQAFSADERVNERLDGNRSKPLQGFCIV